MSLGATIARLVEEDGFDSVALVGASADAAATVPSDVCWVATEVDPARLPEWRSAIGAHGGRGRVVCGTPARALADVAPTLNDRTLHVLDRAHDNADAIFFVPRGEGALVLKDTDIDAVRDQLLRWSPDHRLERVEEGDGDALWIARPQARTHVTFLIEKYTHEYGKSGISINLDNLVETLHQTGAASYDVVHYDERFHEGPPLTARDISKPADVDEHVLVYVCHYHSPANPSLAMLAAAKSSGSRLVGVWLDKLTSVSTPDYAEIADLNVILDGNDFELPRSWPIFTPKNSRYFYDPGLERDVDVSFVGESRYLTQRQSMLRKLENETRIRATIVRSSAADPKRKLTIEEFARVLQTSKISVAFTKDAVKQLKGRIFETMHCGAMLMCDTNPHIHAYFRPGVEYVSFSDYEDMIQKCAYYLAHEDEWERIRKAGHDKVVKYYSSAVFWRSLLARVRAMPVEPVKGT